MSASSCGPAAVRAPFFGSYTTGTDVGGPSGVANAICPVTGPATCAPSGVLSVAFTDPSGWTIHVDVPDGPCSAIASGDFSTDSAVRSFLQEQVNVASARVQPMGSARMVRMSVSVRRYRRLGGGHLEHRPCPRSQRLRRLAWKALSGSLDKQSANGLVDVVTPVTADQLNFHGATPHGVTEPARWFPCGHRELQRPSVCAPRAHERCSWRDSRSPFVETDRVGGVMHAHKGRLAV